jgi:heme/copper-type cytochrome/quinol oxidase subunit 2
LTRIGSKSFIHSINEAETAWLSPSFVLLKSDQFHFSAQFVKTQAFPSQDSESSQSGLTTGLIVGISLSIVAVVIGVIVAFILLCRRRRIESQSISGVNTTSLVVDFIDDHMEGADTTIMTTYTDQVTDEGASQVIGNIRTDFVANQGSTFNV